MSNEFVQALKKNWHLLGVGALLVIGGVVLGMGDDDSETLVGPDGEAIVAPHNISSESPLGQDMNEKYTGSGAGSTNSKTVQMSGIAKKYRDELEAMDADDPLRAKTMLRLGNVLYSKVFDYDNAVIAYLDLIEAYPDTDEAVNAYVSLADCYVKLDDPAGERRTYEMMRDHYAEDSDEYAWAEEQLEK